MTIAVRYFTRSGNTEKLAQAVAGAVEVGNSAMIKSMYRLINRVVDFAINYKNEY